LNGKRLLFNYMDTSATMDGLPIIEKDKATMNGLVQVMGDVLPYRFNHWENIMQTPGLDSLRDYATSLNQRILDESKSYENNVFVDSVFFTYNQMLSLLGDLDKEDSIYTALLPSNAAWNEAYNRILPYFKTKDVDGGALTQRANTLWSMVHDLFFWGELETPIASEELVSTNWNSLSNPDSLFMNSDKKILSNGYAYITNKLYHKPFDSWCGEIRIEAENALGGRLTQNYDVLSNSSLGTNFSASNNSYIYCRATSTSALSPLSLSFPIPNTLSTKYNIYVVFVPTVITDTTDLRPYKLEFSISYNINLATNNQGPQPTYTKLNVANNLTDPLNVTKLLIAKDFEFTTSNITSIGGLKRATIPQGLSSAVNIGLKIRNIGGTSTTEKKNFNRDMRIDCIILEPVQ